MKNALIFILLIFATLNGKACICNASESNFYRNLSSDKTIILVVMETFTIGNEYDERIEYGDFRVLNVLTDDDHVAISDTLKIYGNNDANCGEFLRQFNVGDSLFVTISFNEEEPIQAFLEGCNTNYLKVEGGKCKGLSLAEVIQKINRSIDQKTSCGCGFLEFLFDFYTHVEKPYSFCYASFMDYDYSVEWDDRLYQTGHFKVLDTIANFNLPVNSTFVVIGENGINCGEMLEQYQQGDSLVLALSASPFNSLSPDTFLLKGRYCGSHVLSIENGKDRSDMSYTQIKTKMLSILANEKPFQVQEDCMVYPNPFRSNIYVSNLNSCIRKVRLFDISGRLVMHDEGLNIHQKEYSLASMPDGIYQLEIITTNGCYTRKIIKTK